MSRILVYQTNKHPKSISYIGKHKYNMQILNIFNKYSINLAKLKRTNKLLKGKQQKNKQQTWTTTMAYIKWIMKAALRHNVRETGKKFITRIKE